MMQKYRKSIGISCYIIFVCLLFTQSASARWQTKEDATSQYNFYNESVKIYKDGTSESVVEFEQKLLKEAARGSLSLYQLNYNEAGQKIDIIEAKSINKGKIYDVDLSKIEDKPLASSTAGFDQMRQILIPFSNVEVGSKIYLKLKTTTKKVPLPNYFSAYYYFGISGYEKNTRIKLDSEIPLYITVNDPRNLLNIIKDGAKTSKHIEIGLKKDFSSLVVNEVGDGVVNKKHLTWIAVSSTDSWSDFGKEMGQGYEKVMKQKLPPKFQNIANIAAEEKDEVDQINKVTSMIQDTIQYLGDWKTVEGKLFPRDLATIEKTQLGDCKDFATSTAAILNTLGYQAKVAAVERGDVVANSKAILPAHIFNHAIVYAVGKSGKEYWIDPTNIVSMAGNIFPDIADRWSLVLDTTAPQYIRIPAISYKTSVMLVKKEYNVNKDKIDKKVIINFKGESAMRLTGLGFSLSEKAIADMLYRSVEGKDVDDDNKKRAIIPKLDSRIVKDLKFELEYDQKDGFLMTNLGRGVSLSYGVVKRFANSSPMNVQDNFVGSEETIIRNTLIKGVVVKNIESLNLSIDTPWVKLSRTGKVVKDGVEIIDKTEVLKSYITNEELKSKEYIELKAALEKNYRDVAVLFE